MRLLPFLRLLGLLVCLAAACGAQQQPSASLTVLLLDQAHQPIGGAQVELRTGETAAPAFSAITNSEGHASFATLPAATYQLKVSKDGLQPVQRDVELSAQQPALSIEIIATPELAHRESITVSDTAAAIDQGATTPSQITGQTAKELPGRPANVADALPLISGVVREPGGGIIISAAPEHRNAMVVNSADVTDPATGQFGLTVPIDSVEVLNVYQTAYLAEYGRFTAGLVSVETRRGGDKWKWELNDPLPEFRIRSYHLRGLKTATPRLNFEGPLLPGKLYISEGSEYVVRRTAVYTLPFPHNQKKEQGINSFTQLDWVISPRQLLTGTFHAAPQRLGFVNMDYFNPESTAPDASTRNFTGTLTDHLTIFGGLLEATLSQTRFDGQVWGRGNEDLVITPTGNSGNYFAQRAQTASRLSARATYALAPIQQLGTHQIKLGAYFAHGSMDGQAQQRPVDILDTFDRPLLRLTYPRIRQYDITDRDYAAFAQDHWLILPRLALDMGIRTESQQVSEAVRVAPRIGLTWSILPDRGTTLRAGVGLFYEHVPLNVYCFNKYPDQVVTTFDPSTGAPVSAPTLYLNTLGQSRVRFPFVFQHPTDGNFSPRSVNASIEIEQRVNRLLNLRLRYLQNNAGGIVLLDPLPPDAQTSTGSILLSGSGTARYRQMEATARVRLRDEREVYFSYAYSRARGDLNDFGNYLSTFPTPLIRPNDFGTLPASLPHRFLSWGVFRLPRKFQIAPAIEVRSGFPYRETDQFQNWVGIPNQKRYPSFLSIDTRISRDFQIHPKYALRLAVSGFNLTNHFNPEAVHYNIADPNYGFFFGHRGRRYTADFDFIF